MSDLSEILQTQATILDRASTLVAPGGALVYGTCSVLPAENEAQVQGMLRRHPDWELQSLAPGPGRTERYLQLSPEMQGTDGFFGAVLRRR